MTTEDPPLDAARRAYEFATAHSNGPIGELQLPWDALTDEETAAWVCHVRDLREDAIVINGQRFTNADAEGILRDMGFTHLTNGSWVTPPALGYPAPGAKSVVLTEAKAAERAVRGGRGVEPWEHSLIRAWAIVMTVSVVFAIGAAWGTRRTHDRADTRTRTAVCQVLDELGADPATPAAVEPCKGLPR